MTPRTTPQKPSVSAEQQTDAKPTNTGTDGSARWNPLDGLDMNQQAPSDSAVPLPLGIFGPHTDSDAATGNSNSWMLDMASIGPQDRDASQAAHPISFSEKELEDLLWEIRKAQDVRADNAEMFDQLMDYYYPGHISRHEFDRWVRAMRERNQATANADGVNAGAIDVVIARTARRLYPGHVTLSELEEQVNRNAQTATGPPPGAAEQLAGLIAQFANTVNTAADIGPGGTHRAPDAGTAGMGAGGATASESAASRDAVVNSQWAQYQQYLADAANGVIDPAKQLSKDDFFARYDAFIARGQTLIGGPSILVGGLAAGVTGVAGPAADVGANLGNLLNNATLQEFFDEGTRQPSWYDPHAK
ncbi:hypothetical protein ACFWNH_31060 [Rhodococcus qingshengii]|uniref:hypothetical protein n=1 Tax=Rhodococcus qingshengii TaxID=334542 RepID=UPI00365A39DB